MGILKHYGQKWVGLEMLDNFINIKYTIEIRHTINWLVSFLGVVGLFLLNKKIFNNNGINKIISKIGFDLTKDQFLAIDQINYDLKSNQKMFRLLQGDVGSGKTIVALVASMNVISSGFQVCLMSPTEILAKQHYELAKKVFMGTKIEITFLIGSMKSSIKKKIKSE